MDREPAAGTRAASGARRGRQPSRARRAFLRRAVAVGGLSAAGPLAGCLDGLPDVAGTDTDGGDGSATIPSLRPDTDIGMVFTALGGLSNRSAVDPDEPGGGRLITVDAATPGERVTLDWRETVERERTPATTAVGVGTTTPPPTVEPVERTGTLTVTGLDDAHEPLLPMFWEPGTATTDTAAMWLSTDAYRDLVETRQTAWSRDVLTRISWVGTEVQERIHDGAHAVDEVTLEADPDFVDVELTVDGRPATARAVRAHDSFGNEYVVLADEENPLVVAFTYGAVSVGFTGFDTALWTLLKAVFSGYRVLSVEAP